MDEMTMTSVQNDFLDLQFELLKEVLAADELKRYLKNLKENPPLEPDHPAISDDDFEAWATGKGLPSEPQSDREAAHRAAAAFMAGQPPS
jgi:hypothetical protein